MFYWLTYGILVNIGDQITGNVTMTSTTSGIVLVSQAWFDDRSVANNTTCNSEIHNSNTGVDLSVVITGGPGPLCGHSAEWILEDLTSNGLVPFAEFPTSYFALASSTTSTGTVVGAEAAEEIFIYTRMANTSARPDLTKGMMELSSYQPHDHTARLSSLWFDGHLGRLASF